VASGRHWSREGRLQGRHREPAVRATLVNGKTPPRGETGSLASGRHRLIVRCPQGETQGVWRQGDIGPGDGTAEGRDSESGFRTTLVKPMEFEIVSLPPEALVAPEAPGAS